MILILLWVIPAILFLGFSWGVCLSESVFDREQAFAMSLISLIWPVFIIFTIYLLIKDYAESRG